MPRRSLTLAPHFIIKIHSLRPCFISNPSSLTHLLVRYRASSSFPVGHYYTLWSFDILHISRVSDANMLQLCYVAPVPATSLCCTFGIYNTNSLWALYLLSRTRQSPRTAFTQLNLCVRHYSHAKGLLLSSPLNLVLCPIATGDHDLARPSSWQATYCLWKFSNFFISSHLNVIDWGLELEFCLLLKNNS